jgi:hypothetical protein
LLKKDGPAQSKAGNIVKLLTVIPVRIHLPHLTDLNLWQS